MKISRRHFCAALGALSVTASSQTLRADDQKTQPFRVIAYNVYAGMGWPDDRTSAKQAVSKKQMARLIATELARYEPDLINFSESPSEEVSLEIAKILGMHHLRFPSAGRWPGTILSKLEFVESKNVPLTHPRPQELFTRHWGRGVVKLRNGETLIIHSAHLFPRPDPTVRLLEIKEMLAAMKPDLESGSSVLLMGDLNHTPDAEEYKRWIDAGLVDTFTKAGQGDGSSFKADTPDHRIDYIMAAGPIAHRIRECRALYEGAFRLNSSSDNSFALSDHLPVMATFNAPK